MVRISEDGRFLILENGDKVLRQENEIYSRIVGYYRPVSQWNDGKVMELSQRKTYKASV